MSSEAITSILPPRRAEAERPRHRLLQIYDRFHPVQGWASFVILLLALMIIGMSVQDGSWVPVPQLQSLLIISAITGLGLAKVACAGDTAASGRVGNRRGVDSLARDGTLR